MTADQLATTIRDLNARAATFRATVEATRATMRAEVAAEDDGGDWLSAVLAMPHDHRGDDNKALTERAERLDDMVDVLTVDLKQACKCVKCDGQGTISGYSHISGGQCFDCGGTGVSPDSRGFLELLS